MEETTNSKASELIAEETDEKVSTMDKWGIIKEIFSGVTGAASGGLVTTFVRGVMPRPYKKIKGLMFDLGAWGLGVAASCGTRKAVYKELSDFDPLVEIVSEYAITKKEQ